MSLLYHSLLLNFSSFRAIDFVRFYRTLPKVNHFYSAYKSYYRYVTESFSIKCDKTASFNVRKGEDTGQSGRLGKSDLTITDKTSEMQKRHLAVFLNFV